MLSIFLCKLTNNKWIINNVIGNLVHVIISGNSAMPTSVVSYRWTAMRLWFDHWTVATITVSTLTSPSGRSTVLTETLRAKSRCTDNLPSPYWLRPLRATTLACLLMVKRAVGKAIGLFCLHVLSCKSKILQYGSSVVSVNIHEKSMFIVQLSSITKEFAWSTSQQKY